MQVCILLLFVAVPLANRREFYGLSGNFLFFSAFGLPLADPLSAAQVALGALALPPRLCLGAALTLLLALCLGPVFCSFLCPYGLCSELVHALSPKRGRGGKTLPPLAFAAKCLIVCGGLAAVLFFLQTPLLNQLSMPGQYSRAVQEIVFSGEISQGAALLIPALLAVEFLSGRRFWCLCLCPQSVAVFLTGALLPGRLRVRYRRKSCVCGRAKTPCRESCSLDLDPRKAGLAFRLHCANCGDCVDACRGRGGALRFAFGKGEDSPAHSPAGASSNARGRGDLLG